MMDKSEHKKEETYSLFLRNFQWEDNSFNSFPAQNFVDVADFQHYLETQHLKYFSDIQKQIDLLLLKDNPLLLIKLFIESKISEFDSIEQRFLLIFQRCGAEFKSRKANSYALGC